MPTETNVTETQIAALVGGDENRVFRNQLARLIAARRRCKAAGFGSVSLVTEFHAGRAVSSLAAVEKEAE